jgi:hypothetical protein
MPKNETLPARIGRYMRLMMRRRVVLACMVVIVGMTAYSAYRVSRKDMFGWRLNWSVGRVETKTYTGLAPNIAFSYPETFEVDLNRERYGKNYLVGIKLKTDERTGCDVRTGGPILDFDKSSTDLIEEVVAPIREKVSGFSLLESRKTFIGGKSALRVSFSFLDPIGARVRLDHLFTEDGGVRYFMICGTGEYQYEFFRKDFDVFYDSIDFSGDMSAFEHRRSWRSLFDR